MSRPKVRRPVKSLDGDFNAMYHGRRQDSSIYDDILFSRKPHEEEVSIWKRAGV